MNTQTIVFKLFKSAYTSSVQYNGYILCQFFPAHLNELINLKVEYIYDYIVTYDHVLTR